MDPIKDLTGIVPALAMQPISKSVIALFSKNGGNALGLADEENPLLSMSKILLCSNSPSSRTLLIYSSTVVQLAVQWSSSADDSTVYSTTQRVIERSVAAAKTLGVDNKYIYQNYAAKGQDVFAGYGETNQRRLIEISKRYDPKGVFQKLQPGYFKLGRF